MNEQNILGITPGDIVQDISTLEERVVVDVRLDLGLVAFSDSHLRGWESLEGWVRTGRRI